MLKAQQVDLSVHAAPLAEARLASACPRHDADISMLRVGILLVALGLLVASRSTAWSDPDLGLGGLLLSAGSALLAGARRSSGARSRVLAHAGRSAGGHSVGTLERLLGSPTQNAEAAYERLGPPYLS